MVVVVVRVHRGHRLLHRPAFRSLSLCPAVGPITLPVQHTLYTQLRVRIQRQFPPRPILKVLLLAGIKMMYHHYSSSKVSLSRYQLLQLLINFSFRERRSLVCRLPCMVTTTSLGTIGTSRCEEAETVMQSHAK